MWVMSKLTASKTKAELSADISADVEGYLSSGGVITKVELGVTSNFNPLKKGKRLGGFKVSPLFLKGSL